MPAVSAKGRSAISGRGRRTSRRKDSTARYYALAALVAVGLVAAGGLLYYHGSPSISTSVVKPVILYVNQGNGAVNNSNFASLLSVASSHGFNTVFFQVYRQGTLLFTSGELASFTTEAHAGGLKIYFALYFTDSSQQVPTAVFGAGADGISLDMSALSLAAQTSIFSTVRQDLQAGRIAITTTDFSLPLKPDLLVLETYASQDESSIRPGVVASVGVFATSSRADYESQVQYALQNSDGVMVFDYAGLVKSGY